MLLSRLAAVILLAPLSQASSWVVDVLGGPGVDFTDLPPAIAAAAPGDVIVVHAGTYSQVTGLAKGLTIVGQGVVTIATTPLAYNFQVQGLPSGPPLSITNVRLRALLVDQAVGTVVLQRVALPHGLYATNAADVRLHQMDGTMGSVSAIHSRVEVANCNVVGEHGLDGQSGNPWFPATSGASGIWASGTSRVHVARSSVRGGDGGDNSQAGHGGHGIWVGSGASVMLDGGGVGSVQGGNGGVGDDCLLDGSGGDGLRIDGGSVTRSGASLAGGAQGLCGLAGVPVRLVSGSDVQQVPDAPTLAQGGLPSPGGSITWTVHSEAGSSVQLLLGRTPRHVFLPGIALEELVIPLRTYDLGVVPGSGTVTKTLPLPGSWPLGTRLVAQARVAMASVAEVRHTNSAAVIAR